MTTTTQSRRQHLIEMIQQLDEGHLAAAEALLRILAMSTPAPLPKAGPFVSMPPSAETSSEEDAEFMRTLTEVHDAQQP
jgi:hypothetical protein